MQCAENMCRAFLVPFPELFYFLSYFNLLHISSIFNLTLITSSELSIEGKVDLLCDLGFEFPYLKIGRIGLPVLRGCGLEKLISDYRAICKHA